MTNNRTPQEQVLELLTEAEILIEEARRPVYKTPGDEAWGRAGVAPIEQHEAVEPLVLFLERAADEARRWLNIYAEGAARAEAEISDELTSE